MSLYRCPDPKSKAKYFIAILYIENIIPDWKDQISDLIEYPYAYCVHDKDLDKKGEQRKPHVHLMVVAPNSTTFNKMNSVYRRLYVPGCVAMPNDTCIECNPRQKFDYLIHDTETCRKQGKHLYPASDRVCGNNFDIGLYEQEDIAEKKRKRGLLAQDVLKHRFLNYTDFYVYVISNYDTSYEDIAASNSGFFERLTKGNFLKHKYGGFADSTFPDNDNTLAAPDDGGVGVTA